MYGPPGTGKTLLARACAAQTNATFLKLAGPQLVQMFIGDGAKLVRDAFALAKEKAPAIIFIDELDAIGTKRFDSEKAGDREVQRTMLELLNQLDGFSSDDRVKVLAATNRVDVLDPALLRSGRLDRKIEFPLPNEEARAGILQIHSRKMAVDDGVNWNELARSTDEFGGAMLKAVCVEAGMIALRSGKGKVSHEHYVDAIAEVQSKKKETVSPHNPNSGRNIVTDDVCRSIFTHNQILLCLLFSIVHCSFIYVKVGISINNRTLVALFSVFLIGLFLQTCWSVMTLACMYIKIVTSICVSNFWTCVFMAVSPARSV
jgi:SpoVK/Ycf46/Vps4 family AAA+-type ATPase